jgi:transposase
MPRLSNNDRNQALGMLRAGSGPLNGRLARRPFSRSLRRTVAELIRELCLPGVSLAADAAEVARLFNCHQSTVVRLRQRFQTTNNVSDRPRPGQPRVTTDHQDRNIQLQHLLGDVAV